MAAPAETWTRDWLAQFEFPNNRELYHYLHIQAMKSGFDIAGRQAFTLPYGHFYCTKGGRQKATKTSKVGCTFQFKTTLVNGKIRIRLDDSLCLEHNHDLLPQIFQHKLIDDTAKQAIQRLHEARVKPMQIKTYLKDLGYDLSTLQIQYLAGSKEFDKFGTESEDLVNYMQSDARALVRTMDVRVNEQQTRRFAILTVTAKELENLRRFADVIFIDGTMAKLRMKWEVLPITAVDQHKELVCCGIMYASVTNEEVLTWMLHELWTILQPLGILRTIVTDEDAAFAAAFRAMIVGINTGPEQRVVNHVLCALHKQRNFVHKLQKCGLSKLQREVATDLFRKICYHTNNDYVQKCLEELQGMNEKLSRYVENHVVPYLAQFAKSYMTNVHANGYNTTSPAESMNNLLKQGVTKLMTLRESRVHFDKVLENHDAVCLQRHYRRLRPTGDTGYVPLDVHRHLGAKMCKKLMMQMSAADSIVVEPVEGNPLFTHQAYQRNHPEICYQLCETYCSCNTVRFLGIPCSHLIKLYQVSGKSFPKEMIHRRWHLEPVDDADVVPVAYPAEPEPNERESSDDSDTESDLPMDEGDSSKQRYLRLFHLGKNIASKACDDPETATRVAAKMRELLAELIDLPPDELPNDATNLTSGRNSDEEVVDVVDHVARPRGRPRAIRNGGNTFAPRKCRICGRGHDTTDCFAYPDLQQQTEKFKDWAGDGRRCGICTEPGHNARTCPLKAKALTHYGFDDE